jgi:hypothetical protein
MNRMPFWHLENLPGRFVSCDFADSANVTLIMTEGLRKEQFDKTQHFLLTMLAGSNRNYIGIVVLASQPRGSLIPGQRGTNALHFVRCNLLTVTRATKYNTQGSRPRCLICYYRQRGIYAKTWVVIERIVMTRTVVENFVASLGQLTNQKMTQFETGVIGGYVNAQNSSVRLPICF